MCITLREAEATEVRVKLLAVGAGSAVPFLYVACLDMGMRVRGTLSSRLSKYTWMVLFGTGLAGTNPSMPSLTQKEV